MEKLTIVELNIAREVYKRLIAPFEKGFNQFDTETYEDLGIKLQVIDNEIDRISTSALSEEIRNEKLRRIAENDAELANKTYDEKVIIANEKARAAQEAVDKAIAIATELRKKAVEAEEAKKAAEEAGKIAEEKNKTVESMEHTTEEKTETPE